MSSPFPNAPAAKGQRTNTLKTYVEDRKGHDRRYAIDESKERAELGTARNGTLPKVWGKAWNGIWTMRVGGSLCSKADLY